MRLLDFEPAVTGQHVAFQSVLHKTLSSREAPPGTQAPLLSWLVVLTFWPVYSYRRWVRSCLQRYVEACGASAGWFTLPSGKIIHLRRALG